MFLEYAPCEKKKPEKTMLTSSKGGEEASTTLQLRVRLINELLEA